MRQASLWLFGWTLCSLPGTSGQELENRDLRLRRTDQTEPATPARVPRGYAVVIGIAGYSAPNVVPLRFPESDAEAVGRALISSEGGSFPAENVHLLLGRNATLANLRRELEEWLPAVAQPEDRVVVYFAGHGVVSGGRGYLAPWDVDPARIEESAYPMQVLGNILGARVKARWKALFADACHSGKINAETTDESVAAQLDSAAGQYLSFVATLGRQKSYEDPALSTGFGVFSYFLVQGLQGNADANPCDGLITADELIEYVRANVREYAARKGVQQTPHAGSDYDPAMPMGVSRGCGAGELAPSLSGSLVIESETDGVQIFLDENLVGKAGPGKPLTLPGLAMGPHVIRAAKEGYKPEIKQVTVIPGQSISVTIHMRFPRAVKRAALALGEQGERLLRTRRSTVNPLILIPGTQSQSEGDLRRARDLFTRALQEDPGYSLAAYHLGVTNQLLRDDDGSKAAFRRSLELDPAYLPARLQYADILIATGDAGEALRQLAEALRLEPKDHEIHSRLAGAYWARSAWRECVAAADRALALDPNDFGAHFRRADCLRQTAAEEHSTPRKLALFSEARESYRTFLQLTNYSTPALGWLAYHFVGHGLGSRRHADRKDLYKAWRNSGYLGLCLCEHMLGNLLRARAYCRRAIGYIPDDAIAHFLLGNVNRDLFIRTQSCEYLAAARAAYRQVLALNPNLAEARNARFYLDQFDGMKEALRRRGCL
jgi:tetratricopeptide (TPR) repeat protein